MRIKCIAFLDDNFPNDCKTYVNKEVMSMDDGPGHLMIEFIILTMRLLVGMGDSSLLTSSLIHN
jgi:hypothetical protein